MKPTKSFIIFIILLTFLTSMATFVRAYTLWKYAPLADCVYINSLIGVGVLAIMALALILNGRKLGVYLYPAVLFLSIVIWTKESLIDTVSLVFLLFLFTGYGLVFIIPSWDKYR